jgi:hypothetical protein
MPLHTCAQIQTGPAFLEGDVFVWDADDERTIPIPAGWYIVIEHVEVAVGIVERNGGEVFASDEGDHYYARLSTGRKDLERATLLASAIRALCAPYDRRDDQEQEVERMETLVEQDPEARRIATGPGDAGWYAGERRGTGDRDRMRSRRSALGLSMLETARRVQAITGDARSVNSQRMQLANFEGGKTGTLPAHVLDALALVLADAA